MTIHDGVNFMTIHDGVNFMTIHDNVNFMTIHDNVTNEDFDIKRKGPKIFVSKHKNQRTKFISM